MHSGNQFNDNMHRQSSRSAYNADTIECTVNTSDLAFEDDPVSVDSERKRSSSDARRNSTSRRANGNSTDRSSRHSPPTVTSKWPSSPSSASHMSSRSQQHHGASARHHHVSRSPTSPSSSRYTRPGRPVTSGKRAHSRSPVDRHTSSSHRAYPPSSRKRPSDNEEYASANSTRKPSSSTRTSRRHEATDLSIVSEDESGKPQEHQVHSSTVDESSSTSKLHSTPSVPVLRPTPSQSLLEMSDIMRNPEVSLFAKSSLSMPDISADAAVAASPAHDIMKTVGLTSTYEAVTTIAANFPEMKPCTEAIIALIHQRIDLHQQEHDCWKREIALRNRELNKREQQFEEESNRRPASPNGRPETAPKSTSAVEKPRQQQTEPAPTQEPNTIPRSGFEIPSDPAATDTSKESTARTNSSEKPPSTRATNSRSRFSNLVVNPSIFSTPNQPALELYAGVDEDKASSSVAPSKKPVLSPILAPGEPTKTLIDHDLKVTSSNSCRKVEIQHDTAGQATISKEPSQDLRLMLRNNRNKQQNVDENKTPTDESSTSDEQSATISKPTLTKTIVNDDSDKQQSHDYQQQRSISSTSIDVDIGEILDKRSQRYNDPQYRTSSSRSHPYQRDYPSPSSVNPNERSYSNRSSSHQSSRSGSYQRRPEPDDNRPRYDDQKYGKPARPPHRSYH